MKTFPLFELTLLSFFVLGIMMGGCAAPPRALVPASSQVVGLAVIPQTKVAENALGGKEPSIVKDVGKQEELFSVLEMNKSDASIVNLDLDSHDFVVKWKMQNAKKMDRSCLYLRLNNPRTFIYESDLGGMTKKYVIKVDTEDARTVWNAIGIVHPGV